MIAPRALGAIALALALAGCRSEPARGTSPLAPEVEKAFDLGLGSAEQGQWDEAVRYFGAAQEAEPHFPPILMNLGLAHARAGHEVAAVAWFHAYLAAAPQAANGPAVRREIDRLRPAAQTKIGAMFEEAVASAGAISEEQTRGHAIDGIGRVRALAGDIDGAIKTASLHSDADATSRLWSLYATSLARAGEPDTARDALTHVTGAAERDEVWAAISASLLARLDLDGARKAAYEIVDPETALALIAEVQQAEEARKRAPPPLAAADVSSLALEEWVRFARSISGAEAAANRLRAQAKTRTRSSAGGKDSAVEMPKRLASAASQLGIVLLDMRGLEKRHAALAQAKR